MLKYLALRRPVKSHAGQLNGFRAIAQCGGGIGRQDSREAVERVRPGRFQSERCPKFRHGLAGLAGYPQHIGQPFVGVGVIWVEAQRLGKTVGGLVEFRLGRVNAGQIIVGQGIGGLELGRLAELGFGVFELRQLGEDQAELR